jgi:hypothetical protein
VKTLHRARQVNPATFTVAMDVTKPASPTK